MRMKLMSIFAFIALFVYMFNFSNCEAKKYKTHYYPSTPIEEFVLGGIRIGDSAEYVIKIYGEPTKVYNEYNAHDDEYAKVYCYGDSFKLYLRNGMNRPSTVYRILSTANNGITAKSGIPVGEVCDAVLAYYGYEYVSESVNDYNRQDEINGVYYLRHEEYATLKYEIKNGKIVAICLSNYLGWTD